MIFIHCQSEDLAYCVRIVVQCQPLEWRSLEVVGVCVIERKGEPNGPDLQTGD